MKIFTYKNRMPSPNDFVLSKKINKFEKPEYSNFSIKTNGNYIVLVKRKCFFINFLFFKSEIILETILSFFFMAIMDFRLFKI